MNEELFYLKNSKTKLFLKGFKCRKPLWTSKESDAISYPELEALKMQRRLEIMYAPAQPILLVDKL